VQYLNGQPKCSLLTSYLGMNYILYQFASNESSVLSCAN